MAILAPTTILLSNIIKTFLIGLEEIKIELLTSKIPAKERKEKLNGIANGAVKIVIGHMLFPKRCSL